LIEFTRLRLVNGALYAVATAIFLATALVLYALVIPITVLHDWRVVAPAGTYKVGQTIVIQSLFTKTKEVDGVSHRNLLCINPTNAEVAYPIDNAVANHQAAHNAGVGIPITIPLVVTPTTCELQISIEYKVYPFRTVTQYATSNPFKVVN
jgi:hypothetical protein